jgi:hypothetical protein
MPVFPVRLALSFGLALIGGGCATITQQARSIATQARCVTPKIGADTAHATGSAAREIVCKRGLPR